MIPTSDAVVIGGGILGASTAHFLARLGFGKIVLLEKRTLAAVSTGHLAATSRVRARRRSAQPEPRASGFNCGIDNSLLHAINGRRPVAPLSDPPQTASMTLAARLRAEIR